MALSNLTVLKNYLLVLRRSCFDWKTYHGALMQVKMCPNLFPAGGLYTTPGTVRIRLSTRLAALLLACNLVPFFAVITILQGTFYANVIDPSIFEQLRSDLLRSSFVFMAIGVFLTLQLSFNLKRPFKDIIQALRAVRNGQFDQKVRVTSNDEIGYVGDVINEMTEGLIERDRMLHSLEVAKEVQQNFIPKTEPNVSGLDIAGKSIYCERTGGDYYDYLPLPDSQNGKIGIVIGDVTGHGIPAALLMATVRSSLRQRIQLPGGIGRIISDVNRQLTSDVEDSGRFMTLFYSEIDSENRSIQWVRAGHDPAIFYDPQIDAFEELKGPGIALGVDERWKYAVNRKDDLKDNQIIVLCTDGVWEAHNASGDMFGKDALCDIIRRNPYLPASDIVEAVITALNEFQSGLEPEDDVTLVVVKINNTLKSCEN
jgi:sigma-B regulation protein RsbU (phosphoserine phosphatase)